MAEQYGAINISTANAIGAMLNKKMGVQTGFAPKDWPETSNLLVKLPTKTVSGSVASFSDGADTVPLSSCKATIAPNLEGKNSVTVTHGKKNFLSLVVDYPNYEETKNSMKCTLLSDGKLKFNGTTTANTDFTFYSYSNVSVPKLYVKNGTYTFSNNGNYNVRMVVSGAGNNGFAYRELYGGTTWTSTVTDDTKPFNYVVFRISSGVTLENEIVEPMLEYGSSASSYTPYVAPTQYTAQLGRTIYGGTADVVNGEGTENYGKVVFDGTEGTGGTPSWTMISVTQGTMFRITVSDKATTSATNTLCSYYTPTAQAQRADGTVSGAGTNVDIIDNRFSSVDAFKAWLAENPVTLVYELATATDFTFTGVPIDSYYGVNNVWNNVGGNTEATYRRDCDLALQESEA